jgi:hypothetical protein
VHAAHLVRAGLARVRRAKAGQHRAHLAHLRAGARSGNPASDAWNPQNCTKLRPRGLW